ncbi:hypothetical protein CVT24_004892 [Panaeolus cyanescens]|uniref:F-box domain-containing protein n=1 Tax=Panaeolus cyanescens TaxID=181874 RepID=A0A409W256_9AGAR|nr:hypothetical protein CVT24_004892 [Panaeolus cyanescens]
MFVTEIPLDVLINICEFLNPLDVLILGECSKKLHEFTQTRTLWISLTQQVIHANTLYAPSFPITKLSTRQLQQVACSPTRMIERFRNVSHNAAAKPNAHESASPPKSPRRFRVDERLINPVLRSIPSPILMPPTPLMKVIHLNSLDPEFPVWIPGWADREVEFEKMCLIPGGRFLLLTFGGEAALLDLGIAGYTVENDAMRVDESNGIRDKEKLLIYARWKHIGDDFFMPGPSQDGKELRIAMGGPPGDDERIDARGMVSIVRIWEDDTSPSSSRPATSDNENISPYSYVHVQQHYAPLPPCHSDRLAFFTLVGDLFVYAYAFEPTPGDPLSQTNRVHVWNFVRDECVEWEIATEEYKELFIEGDHVVMVSFPDIIGWRIPPLRPVERLVAAGNDDSDSSSTPSPPLASSFRPIEALPLYPPTFRIPLIHTPNPHKVNDHIDHTQSLSKHSHSHSSSSSLHQYDEQAFLQTLSDLHDNPLNDLETMVVGRLLDWYNAHRKVRKFDAAFARGESYGFWSYGVEGWAGVGGDEGDVDGVVIEPGQDPKIVLEAAMYFKGDKANGVGLVMDPFRLCDGYTMKNIIASDGRAYVMVHDQSGEPLDASHDQPVASTKCCDNCGKGLNGSDIEDLRRRSGHRRADDTGGEEEDGDVDDDERASDPTRRGVMNDRLWVPKRIVTVELGIPGDEKRDDRVGRRDSDYDDTSDEDESSSDEGGEGAVPLDVPGAVDVEGGVQQSDNGEVAQGEASTQIVDDAVDGAGKDDEMCQCDEKNDGSEGSQDAEATVETSKDSEVEEMGDVVVEDNTGLDAMAQDAAEEQTQGLQAQHDSHKAIEHSNAGSDDAYDQDHKLQPSGTTKILPRIPEEGRVRGRGDVSFDPCIGRFCYFDEDRKMLGVVDYLKWV